MEVTDAVVTALDFQILKLWRVRLKTLKEMPQELGRVPEQSKLGLDERSFKAKVRLRDV